MRIGCPMGWKLVLCAAVGGLSMVALAAEPKPIPATRPEIKRALEQLKLRQPRLPLPPAEALEGPAADGRPRVNNGLARRLYLPESWFAADFRPDPDLPLDYGFKTRVFWIVSRGNNCHYCLGHQEHKLAAVGMTDDQLGALDSDWSTFPPREQAAYAFARRLTLAPHRLTDEDFAALRPHFNERELWDLCYTTAFYNSVNRWTDALGLPQDQRFREDEIHFDQPTSERYRQTTSCVLTGPPEARPALESWADVESQWSAARSRQPRLALVDEATARAALADVWPANQPLPAWARALAAFPKTGMAQVQAMLALYGATGKLSPQRKAELAWVTARHNRAFYALHTAEQRLGALGVDTASCRTLDDAARLEPAAAVACSFAAKLTVAPQTIDDDDIAELRQAFSDHEVAEIVYVVAAANFFDRFTIALDLPPDLPAPTL